MGHEGLSGSGDGGDDDRVVGGDGDCCFVRVVYPPCRSRLIRERHMPCGNRFFLFVLSSQLWFLSLYHLISCGVVCYRV